MLMQGISLPPLRPCASVPLLSPLDHPPMPASTEGDLHCFPETNDTTGRAVVRGSTTSLPPTPVLHQVSPGREVSKVTPAKISRTTEWRRRKAAAVAAAAAATATNITTTTTITATTSATATSATASYTATATAAASKRQYTCRMCGKSMTGKNSGEYDIIARLLLLLLSLGTGHSQFQGTRYCPDTSTVSKEQWLTDQRVRAAAKKDKGQPEADAAMANLGDNND